MKTVDLGQIVGILANVGVIAGIIFLALELQQNNRLLSAEAQFALRQSEQTRDFMLIESPEMADVLVRARSGEPLSETDEFRLFVLSYNWIKDWEWTFNQIQAGNLPDDGTFLRGLQRAFRNPEILYIPAEIFRETWETAGLQGNPEFVRYVQTNVLQELD
jgi:hypothetical protein